MSQTLWRPLSLEGRSSSPGFRAGPSSALLSRKVRLPVAEHCRHPARVCIHAPSSWVSPVDKAWETANLLVGNCVCFSCSGSEHRCGLQVGTQFSHFALRPCAGTLGTRSIAAGPTAAQVYCLSAFGWLNIARARPLAWGSCFPAARRLPAQVTGGRNPVGLPAPCPLPERSCPCAGRASVCVKDDSFQGEPW